MDIKSFVQCAKNLDVRDSVLIRGKHGIGKSQITAQLAKHFGLPLIDKRLSQLSEGDMIGLPELVNGSTRFAHPDWYVQACEEPTLLFFDELNRALPEVMQAAFQVVLDRQLNGKSLHKDTRIFAAINNDSMYQVNEMDPALIDRFWIVDLEPTTKDWLDWAKMSAKDGGGEIHPFLIQYVQANETALWPSPKANPSDKQPSPRSMEKMDRTCRRLGYYDADLKGNGNPKAQEFFLVASGYLGTNVANQLVDFVKNLDRQVSAEDILDNWKKVEKKVQGMGQEKWNICIEKVVGHIRKNIISEKQAQNIGEFAKNLPGELVVHFWTELAKEPNPQTQANIKIVHPYMMPLILPVFGKKAPSAK